MSILKRRDIGKVVFEVRLPDGRMAHGILDNFNRVQLVDPHTGLPMSAKPQASKRPGMPMAAERKEVPVATKPGGRAYIAPPEAEDHHDRNFVGHLKSVMKDNQFNRVVRHRQRGKLDMAGLARVATHRQDVFKQKSERKNRQYNIMLLVDESGSMMDNQKSYRAAETARFLAENLARVEGVDFACIGFNWGNHYHLEFGHKLKHDYTSLEREILSQIGGGNNDLHAVREAMSRLRKQEGQKFLLYLSDGQPSEASQVKRYISAQRDVHTIGVGIKYDAAHIPQRIVIQNLDELKPRILNALRLHVTRG